MSPLLSDLRSALLSTLILGGICCGLYPTLVFGIGQLAFRDRANGSLMVEAGGAIRGSRLLGQRFAGNRYFHPRPSAAGDGYDATASGGSNLGPTSQKLRDSVQARVVEYRRLNGLGNTETVPADAVTASGSGLDPHISVRNAAIQAARVAQARGLPIAVVENLIRNHTTEPDWGLFGNAGVNVLGLNLALDKQGAAAP